MGTCVGMGVGTCVGTCRYQLKLLCHNEAVPVLHILSAAVSLTWIRVKDKVTRNYVQHDSENSA